MFLCFFLNLVEKDKNLKKPADGISLLDFGGEPADRI